MDVTGRTTVFFEEPFWVAVCECESGGRLTAARVVFGAEPKDYQVYAYFLERWNRLRFSPPVEAVQKRRHLNPKRIQREIVRTLDAAGVGTKAQQAIGLAREQAAQTRKADARKRRDAEKKRRFELRRQKAKKKHRGG